DFVCPVTMTSLHRFSRTWATFSSICSSSRGLYVCRGNPPGTKTSVYFTGPMTRPEISMEQSATSRARRLTPCGKLRARPGSVQLPSAYEPRPSSAQSPRLLDSFTYSLGRCRQRMLDEPGDYTAPVTNLAATLQIAGAETRSPPADERARACDKAR